MSFVECKCPNCGAPVKINTEEDASYCEYCGKAFINEKAINISGGDYVKRDKIVNNVKQDNEWTYKKTEKIIDYLSGTFGGNKMTKEERQEQEREQIKSYVRIVIAFVIAFILMGLAKYLGLLS